MGKQQSPLILILALVAAAIFVLVQLPIRLGLDLQGGSQLTILVKPTTEIPSVGDRELEAVQRVIENRVNGLGVSEAVIQTAGSDKILVQLPGVSDPEQAERVLGGTAQLEFREQNPGTEAAVTQLQQVVSQARGAIEIERRNGDPAKVAELEQTLEKAQTELGKFFGPAQITGKSLKDALAQPTQSGNSWEVALRFDTEGGDQFAALTKNLAGTGRSIGIFLDGVLISAPVVGPEFAQTGITGGSAVITGRFTTEQADDLAIQLRGGALPLPVEIVENRTVGATLGRDSIQRSIYAGVGGLLLVLVFMVVYYQLPGLIADISLAIYAILSLAAFNLLGVTLTLPGIAGFLLSIGMAVDANVLIFERTREELRAGKSLYRSVESGFYRAFSSILDSNVTTLIACGALFWLSSGLVKGFALTLAIGVMVSMFTAITCSRTLMFLAIANPALRKPQLFDRTLTATKS
ncbi:protein translocase subunit SecD [Synechococcus elongatus]|uniref:protein translocase subunit SecD n=1 Tax=Synechococcus elongatus TaxID=32046 RepID=UPI0030D59974